MSAVCAPLGLHIWTVCLDEPPWPRAVLARCLSEDEQRRAGRLLFDVDRRRFAAARGTLRMLLARYTGRDASELSFRSGPHGKPALDAAGPQPPPAFNLSHSGSILVLVVGPSGRRVGVDVEVLRRFEDPTRLARATFAPPEVAIVRAAAAADSGHAFLRLWARKEALHKADGRGLSLPLDTFDVSHPRRAGQWWLEDLRPIDGYVGAVAYDGARSSLVYRGSPDPMALMDLS